MADGVPKRTTLDKIVLDYEILSRVLSGLQTVNHKIVVTIGSWDLLHIGHLRYLIEAKNQGDILVVGVDSDRVIKTAKGPLRPIVPENERCEMLSYQTCVDFITLLDDTDKNNQWQYGLIKKIKPDYFVAEEESYTDEQLAEIKKHCGKLIVLPRQAKNTSTSKMIQDTVKRNLDLMYSLLEKRQ